MIIVGGGGNQRGGCIWLPVGLLFLALMSGSSSLFVPLLMMLMLGVLVWAMSQGRTQQQTTEEEFIRPFDPIQMPTNRVPPPPRVVEEHDKRIQAIRRLRESIESSLNQNKDQSVIQVTGEEIRQQAIELAGEAEQIYLSRGRMAAHLNDSQVSRWEIDELTQNAVRETNPKVKAALEATLESRRAEMENVKRMGENIRYLDALLDQAEATLSELKTRISLTLAETEDYTNPRSRLALTESSEQLRSVSEAMRQTLNEL